MAYPGENQNKAYMDYAIDAQSNGQQPLPIDQWLQSQMQGGGGGMGQKLPPEALIKALDVSGGNQQGGQSASGLKQLMQMMMGQ